MHYLPDTEDEDSAAEKFWPEGYKQIIRESIPPRVFALLKEENHFELVFAQHFKETYSNLDEFLKRIGDMVAVGAENGADGAFNDIMDAFLYEKPLPDVRRYARYLWPKALSEEATNRLKQVVVDEYIEDNIYSNAYRMGYTETYESLDAYIDRVSEIVIVGTKNGANDTLERIYRSFLMHTPLIPARRNPRRLKIW